MGKLTKGNNQRGFMPTKKTKDKPKRCKWCNKEIVLYTGTTGTWIHFDTGKSKGDSPFVHNAMPR
jgi:hypothetical protein